MRRPLQRPKVNESSAASHAIMVQVMACSQWFRVTCGNAPSALMDDHCSIYAGLRAANSVGGKIVATNHMT
jgi:hypothetical protein